MLPGPPLRAGGPLPAVPELQRVPGALACPVGAPLVDGASVAAHVEDHMRGEKIHVFKYKPKKRYRRKIGHRQELTELTITGIKV